MKPSIVVFSSTPSYPIALGIEKHLKDQFTIHPWKGDFFGENKTTPLWTFFKKLFHYDYAILVLSNDNVVRDEKDENTKWIPSDNVIFELGATMARLGPQKTILVVPDQPKITLPSYFDDVKPYVFTYHNEEHDENDENVKVTAEVANSIREILDRVTFSNFHSELPAQGLAYAYLVNFFNPVTQSGYAQSLVINNKALEWTPESGMTFTVIIPDSIMGRNKANDFFEAQNGCYKTNFKVKDGRDPAIYVLPRTDESSPLHVLDIPTTLITAESIIEKIERFWRETDSEKVKEVDNEFMEALIQREIINFRRTLEEALKSAKVKTFIISSSELEAHIERLNALN